MYIFTINNSILLYSIFLLTFSKQMAAKLPHDQLQLTTKRNKFMLKSLLLRTETYASHA
jgi:hypothetical protein